MLLCPNPSPLIVWCTTFLICLTLSVQLCMGQLQTFGKRPATYNNMPSDNATVFGLVLNPNYSAPCDGNVIAWNFCYYLNGEQSQSSINVSVWRPQTSNDSTLEYHMVSGSNGLIEISAANGTYQTQFVCQTWELPTSFSVMAGDLVGAYFSENVSIHILGSVDNKEILRTVENPMDTQVITNLTTEPGYGMYLEAVLDVEEKECVTNTVTITTGVTESEGSGSGALSTLSSTSEQISTSQTTTSTITSTTQVTASRGRTDNPNSTGSPTVAIGNNEDLEPVWMVLSITIAVIALVIIAAIASVGICLCYKLRKKNKLLTYTTSMMDTAVKLEQGTFLDSRGAKRERARHFNQNGVHVHALGLIYDEISSSPNPSHHSDQSAHTHSSRSVVAVEVESDNHSSVPMQNGSDSPVMQKPMLPRPYLLTRGRTYSTLKRSNSENDILHPQAATPQHHFEVGAHSDSEQERYDDLCTSTESNYPYVLHSREVLGHTPLAHVRSLPNIPNSPGVDSLYAVPDTVIVRDVQNTPVYSYAYADYHLRWLPAAVRAEGSNNVPSTLAQSNPEHPRHSNSVLGFVAPTARQQKPFFIPLKDPPEGDTSRNHTNNKARYSKSQMTPQYSEILSPSHHFSLPTKTKPGLRKPKPLPRRNKAQTNQQHAQWNLQHIRQQQAALWLAHDRPYAQVQQTNQQATLNQHVQPSKQVEMPRETFVPPAPVQSSEGTSETVMKVQPHLHSQSSTSNGDGKESATSPSTSTQKKGYMKLNKDSMDQKVSLYQHLLRQGRQSGECVSQDHVLKGGSEKSIEGGHQLHQMLHAESQSRSHKDAAAVETSLEKSNVLESTDEYLQPVTDFIGGT